MKAVLLIGSPGSGKSTIGKRISKDYKIPHISTGDIVRGDAAAVVLSRDGSMVPHDMMMELVRVRLAQQDCAFGFILDGFPRTLLQAEVYDSLVGERIADITQVIEVDVSENVAFARLNSRGRSDDTEATIVKRLGKYHSTIAEIREYCEDNYYKVDGEGTVDEVYKLIKETIVEIQ